MNSKWIQKLYKILVNYLKVIWVWNLDLRIFTVFGHRAWACFACSGWLRQRKQWLICGAKIGQNGF